jgi:ribosome-binding protein aMBF1 (putative translation factor)
MTTIDIEKLTTDKAFRDALMEKIVRESIAKQIRDLRAWKGWTQEELAKRLETKASVIARLENPDNPHLPTVSTLCKIAAVFDVALMVRFERWDKFLVVMGEDVLWGENEDWAKLQEWAVESD